MSNIFDLSKYGEKLGFAVREKINHWDKEVSVISAGLDMVSYATDELVNEVKSGLDETRAKYEKCSG